MQPDSSKHVDYLVAADSKAINLVIHFGKLVSHVTKITLTCYFLFDLMLY